MTTEDVPDPRVLISILKDLCRERATISYDVYITIARDSCVLLMEMGLITIKESFCPDKPVQFVATDAGQQLGRESAETIKAYFEI